MQISLVSVRAIAHYNELTDHATLNFNSNISMAAVFSDIEKVFDT
jgi:hypothetical protein